MEGFTHRTGQTLRVGDAEVYYEELAREHTDAVVLLHGGLGTLEDFNPLVPFLIPNHRLIAIDARGHGGSTLGTAPLSYALLQADVLAVVRHLGIEHFHVVGFSDGGIVGLRLARSATCGLARLAVLGTPHTLRDDEPLRDRLAAVTAESWRAKFPETVENYQRVNPTPDFDALVRASVAMWIDLSEDGYPAASVGEVRCPVLVARGDDDPLVTRAVTVDLVEQLASAMPMAERSVRRA